MTWRPSFASLGGPIIALGHSRGGTASLLLAAKYPDLVRALILIDPTILPFSWMWWWYLAKKTGAARFVPIAYRAAGKTAGLAGPGNDFSILSAQGVHETVG